jgi:hypothetical protein
MTDKKTKTESSSPLRTPKPKNKLGLKVPQIAMPHEDMIRPNHSTELTILPKDETLPRQSSHTRHTSQTRQTEIAPTKNYQKVPNSISKQAVPEGWFKGKSKQLYDALYSVTRGAIVPVRKVRIQKSRLMKLAAIGSRITFDSNIEHLIVIGLIKEKVFAGEHEGNEFEVLLPEEISLPSQSSQSSLTTLTSHAQKQDRLVILETRQTSQSSELTNTRDLDTSKTLFKTLKEVDDDAPIANVLEKLNEMAQKLTGKDLAKKELEKLSELFELLISETIVAAARTCSVSSPIAFMTENLRRRLYSKPRSTSSEKKDLRPSHLDVGKKSDQKPGEAISWTPQTPLTQEQRENTLSALKEAKAADSIFYREFKTYGEIEYTSEDFEWLLENLEKENM